MSTPTAPVSAQPTNPLGHTPTHGDLAAWAKARQANYAVGHPARLSLIDCHARHARAARRLSRV
jgi:hypothetical protein